MSYSLPAGLLQVPGTGHRVPGPFYKTLHSRFVDEARVHFLYATSLDHFANVALPNSAPGHDRDPIARLVHQPGDCICSIEHRGFPTGSQDALNANVYQLFDRLRRISHQVECAMEGHW